MRALHLTVFSMIVLFSMGASPPTEVIEGWVIDPAGEPVVGATVLARAKAPTSDDSKEGAKVAKRQKDAVADCVTDGNGRFKLEVPGTAPFTLRASAPGLGAALLEEVPAGEAGMIQLAEGWAVEGQVLQKLTGDPVAGAEVKAAALRTHGLADKEHREHFEWTATAGEDGVFVIDGLGAEYYSVTASADGYSTEALDWVAVGIEGASPDPQYLYLLPGVSLTGEVVDGKGRPIEEARIAIQPEEQIPGRFTRWMRRGGFVDDSDEEGRFEIRGVPPESSYAVQVKHDEYAMAWMTGVESDGDGRIPPVKFVLDGGNELTARLLAGEEPFDGKLKANLRYSVMGSDFSPSVYFPAEEIDLEDGKLTLKRLPEGRARLTIEPDGFTEIEREDLTIPTDQPVDLGEITLDPGLRITGKVLNAEDEPIAEAEIEATSFGGGAGYFRGTTHSGEDGAFVIGGLEEAAYRLTAKSKGYADSFETEIQPDGDPVEIRLQKAGKITGRVLAGDPPEPLAGFTVTPKNDSRQDSPFPMFPGGRGKQRGPYRDPSGKFTVTGLSEGSYSISIHSKGLVTERREKIEVTPGEAVDIGDITLSAGATLHGTVVEAGTGKPIGGAAVSIEGPGLFNMGEFIIGNAEKGLLTEPNGSFTLAGLAPGEIEILVKHESYSTKRKQVAIAGGVPPAEITVELSSGGVIEGTVRDSKGELVAGGMVMVMRGFTPSGDGPVPTDEFGHFRVERLPPGTYRVMAMPMPGKDSDSASILSELKMQTVEVREGKTSIVHLPPKGGMITVNGIVRRGSKPLEARMFWMLAAADGQTPKDFASASSDDSGSYQVKLSSHGEYRVMVMPVKEDEADFPSTGMSVKVEIPEGGQVTKDIVIAELLLAGVVLDVDSGLPLDGVEVIALEYSDDDPPAMFQMASSAETDEEGRYELEGLGEGSYSIGFAKSGYGAEIVGPITMDEYEKEEGLNVSLTPSAECRIRVVNENGDPVEGAMVTATAMPMDMLGGQAAITDVNGEAKLTGLGDGAHDLNVITKGLAPHIAEGVIVGGKEAEVAKVTVRRGTSLRIAVVDGDDKPVSEAAIRIRNDAGVELSPLLQFAAIMTGQGLITDSQGIFEVPHLEAGRYEVEARWQGKSVIGKVRVKGSGENSVELKLK
jgi:uncharacterized GH25 family protein